jgi:hypothetical protein
MIVADLLPLFSESVIFTDKTFIRNKRGLKLLTELREMTVWVKGMKILPVNGMSDAFLTAYFFIQLGQCSF